MNRRQRNNKSKQRPSPYDEVKSRVVGQTCYYHKNFGDMANKCVHPCAIGTVLRQEERDILILEGSIATWEEEIEDRMKKKEEAENMVAKIRKDLAAENRALKKPPADMATDPEKPE